MWNPTPTLHPHRGFFLPIIISPADFCNKSQGTPGYHPGHCFSASRCTESQLVISRLLYEHELRAQRDVYHGSWERSEKVVLPSEALCAICWYLPSSDLLPLSGPHDGHIIFLQMCYLWFIKPQPSLKFSPENASCVLSSHWAAEGSDTVPVELSTQPTRSDRWCFYQRRLPIVHNHLQHLGYLQDPLDTDLHCQCFEGCESQGKPFSKEEMGRQRTWLMWKSKKKEGGAWQRIHTGKAGDLHSRHSVEGKEADFVLRWEEMYRNQKEVETTIFSAIHNPVTSDKSGC